MKMIVGLGNPGQDYFETRHNIGFMVVDELARRHQCQFKQERTFQADVASYNDHGEKVLLVKPTTFMNESGRAVYALKTYYNIDLEDIMIVYDDMDLQPGRLRLRATGSAGGHNGIKSLIQHLKTQQFQRTRVGIGRPQHGKTVVNHVLSTFSKQERPDIDTGVVYAADAVEAWVEMDDFNKTMNDFNKK